MMKQGLEQLRLAVILKEPFWYDGKSYTTRQPFAAFVTSFARYVKELILFVPLKVSKHEKGDFEIFFDSNVKIISCPFYNNTRELYKRSYKIIPGYIKKILNNINKWDICWVVDTNIISFASCLIAKWKAKKTFLYIRANSWSNNINQSVTKFGKLEGYVLAILEEIFVRSMVRGTLTFTVGDELFTKYKTKNNSVYCFHANLLSEKLISRRKKIKNCNDKWKLLVVGRLVRQKGLEYLVEAVDELVNKHGFNLKCYIVGTGCEENKLKNLTIQKNLHERFKFLGHIPWGEELFDIYRGNDLFILPSLTEGFPKTIFEAMAFGLPVIATDVGGISGIIKHKFNGMLIAPKSSDALVDTIQEICCHENMYETIKENGYNTVKEFTIEKQVRKMQDIIANHFGI